MISFDEPAWFTLFLLWPVLIRLRYFWRGRGGRIRFPFRVWEGDGFRPSVSWMRFVLLLINSAYWLGAALLVTALAGPEIVEREEVYLSRGIDIMIVLDQSPSMGAEDFPPVNRFDTATEMIRRFIDGRKGDSIGLVTFGSQAVLRCPPTPDYEWLAARLDELQLRELGDDTAIGMGLAVAALHLADSSATEKIILLLTDGDDNAGEIRPGMAAEIAAAQGIKIYSIGIGSDGQAPIELTDPETGQVTRGMISTSFDEDQLRQLADVSGGGYWRASSPGALETVFQAVDSLESVERRVTVRVQSRPVHRRFIMAGFAAIAVALILRKLIMGETL